MHQGDCYTSKVNNLLELRKQVILSIRCARREIKGPSSKCDVKNSYSTITDGEMRCLELNREVIKGGQPGI